MCYSLWYNEPTMLSAGVRQHRGLTADCLVNFLAMELLHSEKTEKGKYICLVASKLLMHCHVVIKSIHLKASDLTLLGNQ